jgi:hypothetical protein
MIDPLPRRIIPVAFATLIALAGSEPCAGGNPAPGVVAAGVVHEGSVPPGEPGAGTASVGRLPQSLPITELKFRDFYRLPLGPRGLELTDTVRALEGQTVRIVGYMAQYGHATPGTLLLTSYPVKMDDCHYGLADDLPPQTLHVTVPRLAGQKIAFRRGPLVLTGRLEVGPKDQPDGRNFAVRLVLDEATAAGVTAADTTDAPADHATCATCRAAAAGPKPQISAGQPPQPQP